MNQQIIMQSIEILLLALVSVGLLLIVVASIYNITTTRRRRTLDLFVRKVRRPRQPHVTVLVYAQNDAASVEACLKSIIHSRYYEYDIVVIDNVSSDNTKKVVRDFKAKHQNLPIYLYAKLKSNNCLLSLRQGYAKSKRGEIILVLSADSIVSPILIKESVAYLAMNPKVKVLSMAERMAGFDSIDMLAWSLLQLTRNIYAKSTSQLAIGRIKIGTLNAVYKREVFIVGNYKSKAAYAYVGDLLRLKETQATSWADYVLSIITVAAVTYFMYIAATMQSSELLIMSWLIYVVWLLLTIWSDDRSTTRQKLQLSFFVPSFYFLSYVLQIITLITGSGLVMRAFADGANVKISS